jgi:hypothetical protein
VPAVNAPADGVNVSVGQTGVMVYDLLPVQALLSVAVIVNVCETEEVGVPVIWPFALFKLRPAGNVPLVTANVNVLLPPVALTVCVPYEVSTVPLGRLDGDRVIVGHEGVTE